jgi:hypothetical protein
MGIRSKPGRKRQPGRNIQVSLTLHTIRDEDLIAWLADQESYSESVRVALRAYIAKREEGN